jgi:hypothetical protein
MITKAEAQQRHAMERFAQRFCFRLSHGEYQRLCDLIRYHYPCENSGMVKFLCRTSTRVTHWAVLYEDQWLVMIYHRESRRISTVLPSQVLRTRRYRESAHRHGLLLPAYANEPVKSTEDLDPTLKGSVSAREA